MPRNNIGSKRRSIALIFFYIVGFFGIVFSGYSFYLEHYKVYIEKDEIIVDNNNIYQIDLLPKYSDNYNIKNYVFEVEDSNIVTVNQNGIITPVSKGETYVKVKFKNSLVSEKIHVIVDDVNINSIEVDSKIQINKDETTKLSIKINNNETISKSFKFSSSDEDVVVVDALGNITGLKSGKAIIIITSDEGLTKEVEVVVSEKNEKIERMQFSNSSITMYSGDYEDLVLDVYPKGASTKDIKWTTNNSNVVKLEDGKIIGREAGSAVVSAKTDDGITASIVVNVKDLDADEEDQKEIDESHVILNVDNITMYVGDNETLVATVINNQQSNIDVNWSSSNNNIVSVDSHGKIVAKKAGTATITARINDKESSTCKITVKNVSIEVESIKITNKNNLLLHVDDTAILNVDIKPSNATNKVVSWSSSNNSVVKVDSHGNIRGLKAGSAVIKAKSNNGKTDSINVIIENNVVPVASLKINYASKSINIGDNLQLSIEINPINASNKTITWTSSNSGVVSVNSKGLVKGIGIGTAVVTAKSNNGKTATCIVTVNKVETSLIQVSSVTLNKSTTTIEVGKSETLIATVSPSNATNKAITWSSSNKNIAIVDSNGMINAISPGTAVVTAKSNNGKTASCNVTIKSSQTQTIEVSSISIKSSTTIEVGKSEKLSVTINPSNATNKQVTWTSSDNSIATVDQNGNVKAINVGTTTITAKSSNGKTSTCKVKVEEGDLVIYFYNPTIKTDAIIVISNKKAMIIDGGFYQDERDNTNNKSKFMDFIKSKKSAGEFDIVEYYVGTHGHYDHITMSGDIIKTFNIKNIIVPVGSFKSESKWFTYNNKKYKNYTIAKMLSRVDQAKGITKSKERINEERSAIVNANIKELKAFDEFKLGNSKITVLNPIDENWPNNDDKEVKKINKNSLVLRIDHGKTSFLLAADAATDDIYKAIDENNKKNNKGDLLQADMYKNGHHHYSLLKSNGKIKNHFKQINPKIVVMTNDVKANNTATIKEAKTINDMCIYSVSKGTIKLTSNGCQIDVTSSTPPINESKCSTNFNKC